MIVQNLEDLIYKFFENRQSFRELFPMNKH